ncbi:MAG: ORF6N domain-containing protein [Bacteroidota bacterium]|nr:ORF6N domain-containing protein [Bacteroidota bacterium]
MAKKELEVLVAEQKILNKIYVIRGEKVMLDRDLAELYGTETRILKQAVKRNITRFPKDFMFEMTTNEFKKWREGTALSAADKQGLRYAPFCFTEQGLTMLSCILNSKTAIEVNIRIVRVFVKMREYALTHKEILLQLAKLEKEVKGNNHDIENIFMVLKELIEKQQKPLPPRNKIGFKNYD